MTLSKIRDKNTETNWFVKSSFMLYNSFDVGNYATATWLLILLRTKAIFKFNINFVMIFHDYIYFSSCIFNKNIVYHKLKDSYYKK